jgi:hypothetical protein
VVARLNNRSEKQREEWHLIKLFFDDELVFSLPDEILIVICNHDNSLVK